MFVDHVPIFLKNVYFDLHLFFFFFFNSVYLFIYFFNFNFYFILLYNTVLVLPYIDMNLPRVYVSSQSWTPLPPSSPYHLSGSSQCISPKHPVSCIEPKLAIHFLHDSIHVSQLSKSMPQLVMLKKLKLNGSVKTYKTF